MKDNEYTILNIERNENNLLDILYGDSDTIWLLKDAYFFGHEIKYSENEIIKQTPIDIIFMRFDAKCNLKQ